MMEGIFCAAAVALAAPVSAGAGGWIEGANRWVEGQLAGGSGWPSGFVFLFLGGLLASLLPCVYPLYPITAGIIRGRAGEGGARWQHPLAYYFGLAAIYCGLGLVAGVTGGAFNAVLRWPMVNVALALLFFVLALATAGFLHIGWFGGGAGGGNVAGVRGTFLMGMGAGLLSSSCVGPFVVGILVALAGQAAGGPQVMTIALAASKMLAFGLGVGLPFLAVGLFGARLPRSGGWMRWVQWALGALIGWFAYAYLDKGLGSLGVGAAGVAMVFWGAIALVMAVYFAQGGAAPAPERMARAVWALVAVAAAVVMARGAHGGAPAAAASLAGPEVIETGGLSWYVDREDALAEARRTGRPIFIDFFAHWCANCKEFDRRVATDPELNAALGRAVRLKIQDTDPEFKEYQADPRFPELKVGLPFFAITDAGGHLLYKTSDLTRTSEMVLFLEE